MGAGRHHPITYMWGKRFLGDRWVPIRSHVYSVLPAYPAYPACYVVYSAGRLIYIGSTANLKARFQAHKQAKSFPEGITLKVRFSEKWGDWAMREIRLLHKLRPANQRVVRRG